LSAGNWQTFGDMEKEYMRGAKYKGDTSNNVLNNTHSLKTLQYTMTKWSTLCKAKCTDIFN
jgi:hypothetical protein